MFFQWFYPKADDIQDEQANYIEEWMANFEEAVFSPNYYNSLETDVMNILTRFLYRFFTNK